MKILILILIFTSTELTGRNYYLSEYGNDRNDGLTPHTAWRTLQRFQEQIPFINPGDSILFSSASIFRGSLMIENLQGLHDSKIFITNYGKGANPKIVGSIKVSHWIQHKKNIWKSKCVDCIEAPSDLYVNNVQQKLGRYPDSGFLIANANNDHEIVFEKKEARPDNYWNGAEVVVTTSPWTLDALPITSSFLNSIHINQNPSYPLAKQVRCFIQRSLNTLTSNGEWFYDNKTQNIYFYHDTIKPNNTDCEISFYNNGFTFKNCRDIIVDGLTFCNQRENGIEIEKCIDVTFSNNMITNAGGNGQVARNNIALVLTRNIITNVHNNAIDWRQNSNSIIKKNTLMHTGMHPGRGGNGTGTYTAMYISGGRYDSCIIDENIIINTGYSAIDFRTGHTTITHNFIRNFCLVKDDGAAIYTWNNNYGNNMITHNAIVGSLIKTELTTENELYRNGIYIDDRSEYITISKNMVAFCDGAGIIIHNAGNINIENNHLMGNGHHLSNHEKSQLVIKGDDIVKREMPISNIEIKNNSMLAMREDERCLLVYTNDSRELSSYFFANENNYVASRNDIVGISIYNKNNCEEPEGVTLRQLQSQYGIDKTSNYKILSYEGFETIKQLLPSAPKETTWIAWPDESKISYNKTDKSLTVIPPIGNTNDVLLYHSGLAFSCSKLYKLKFTIRTEIPGTVVFVPLTSQQPWSAIGNYYCVATDVVPKTVTYYFRPTKNEPDGRLNFSSKQAFWIDDIALYEVQAKDIETELSGLPSAINKLGHANLSNQVLSFTPVGNQE